MQKADVKQYVYAIIGIVLMFCGWFIPAREPITEVGMQIIGIFIGLVWLWSTSGMLWPSFLGIAALIVSDYGTMNSVLAASIGNYNVITCILMMAIFGLIEQYGVNDYIIRWILTRRIINGRPWLFTFIYLFAALLLSVVCSPFATLFLFWALTYKLAEDLGYKKGDSYISLLIFGIAFCAALSAPVLPFKAWILQIAGIWQGLSGVMPFSYAQHLGVIGPLVLLMLLAYVLLMCFVFRADVEKLAGINADYFNSNPLPSMNGLQKGLLIFIPVFILLLFLPSVLPANWSITIVLNKLGVPGLSMIAFVAFCIVRVDGNSIVDLKYLAGNKVSWDLPVLLACVMAVSAALTDDMTGVKPFMQSLLNPILGGMSPFVLFAVVAIVCIILTNLANNGVVALLLLSIVYITLANMNIPNIGYFVSTLACLSQVAFLIPGSSLYGALLHGNEWLSAGFIYKLAISVAVVALVTFIAIGWPLSLLLY